MSDSKVAKTYTVREIGGTWLSECAYCGEPTEPNSNYCKVHDSSSHKDKEYARYYKTLQKTVRSDTLCPTCEEAPTYDDFEQCFNCSLDSQYGAGTSEKLELVADMSLEEVARLEQYSKGGAW